MNLQYLVLSQYRFCMFQTKSTTNLNLTGLHIHMCFKTQVRHCFENTLSYPKFFAGFLEIKLHLLEFYKFPSCSSLNLRQMHSHLSIEHVKIEISLFHLLLWTMHSLWIQHYSTWTWVWLRPSLLLELYNHRGSLFCHPLGSIWMTHVGPKVTHILPYATSSHLSDCTSSFLMKNMVLVHWIPSTTSFHGHGHLHILFA